MSAALTVACVLRRGGPYDAVWVERLRDGVARHLDLPHRFVCLTDLPVWCEAIPLEHKFFGFWAKLEAFRRGLFAGPVLYLDLDVIVTGSLDPLVAAISAERVTMAREFTTNRFADSCVMGWHGDFAKLLTAFATHPAAFHEAYRERPEGRRGDQAYIEDVLASMGTPAAFFDEAAPTSRIVSYKHEARRGLPADAAVVSFHGFPKMDKAPGWPDAAWRGEAKC